MAKINERTQSLNIFLAEREGFEPSSEEGIIFHLILVCGNGSKRLENKSLTFKLNFIPYGLQKYRGLEKTGPREAIPRNAGIGITVAVQNSQPFQRNKAGYLLWRKSACIRLAEGEELASNLLRVNRVPGHSAVLSSGARMPVDCIFAGGVATAWHQPPLLNCVAR